MPHTIRSVLALAVGGLLIAFVVTRTQGLQWWLSRDFLEYWAAGRLNARGDNPYDPAQLLAEQRAANPGRHEAVMMWNPPPALAVYMPLAALPAGPAVLLWVGLQLYAALYAARLLWIAYAPDCPRWPPAVVAVSCAGTWWVVAYGQNAGLLLFGLAGFLHYTRANRPLAAGACAALTALKPHLLAVFGVLLVADALTRRGGKTLAAGVAAVALALGVAVAANPHVVAQFVEAARHPAEGAVPLSSWWLPVPAFWLREWLAPDHFWVQFVPCAVACVAYLVYRVRKGRAWDWSRELPLVVAVSVLTTPYGGWLFDLPVLLVPMVWAAARLVRAEQWALAFAFALGQATITAITFARPAGLHDYWWVAPSMLALCLLAFAGQQKK